ncbi:ABC transporter permease [Candidatus Bathyarchaeota archaeon]|nr:MAG: ABC transporter permease [Candidatus Bathyarchaeota archaeon]
MTVQILKRFLQRWLDLLKGFFNILVKELKELVRDPKILLGMIIVPLIIFPVLGSIMSYSVQTAQEQAQKATVLVIDNDGGNWSQEFVNLLNSTAKVYVEENVTLADEVVQQLLSHYNTTQIIEIPKGFSENVTQHLNGSSTITATLKFYGVFTGSGIFEGIGASLIDNLVYQFNRAWAPDIVLTEKSSIIKGEIKQGVDPASLSGLMMSQSIALPITIMILLQVAMQIAATSVAMEKEEKTLETLLTLPMDRFAILMGKLSGSIIVAAVGALAFMIGYNYMLFSFTMQIPAEISVDLASLGLVPSLFGYLLLGISLFVTLISALALAVIISAFAEDVRGAQSLVGYIYPVIFIPALALMYLDISSLPFALQMVFYAIPYSHPIIASKAVIMGDYWTAIFGIVYVAVFTIVLMYAASRLFATEKILTAKLKFKGLRRRRKKTEEEF